jgi:hypothetical protein
MCAARNYGLTFDTEYNRKLSNTLRKYNMEKDTNGEPDIFPDRLVGGAMHPHLVHPLLGSMSREMQGGRRRDYLEGGMRPPGGVSPYIQSVSPNYMVQSGTMAGYPAYNAVELRSINGVQGGFFGPALMAVGRVAGPALASAVVSALASKGIDKVMGSGSATCASCEAAQPKRGRGRPKKGGNILDRKFSINEVKDTGRQLLGLGSILDEKFSINDVGRTGKKLFGLGKKGRPKKGGSLLGDLAKKVGSLGQEVVSVAKPVIKDVVIDVGKEALKSYLTKKGKGVMSGGLAGVGKMKGGAVDGRKKRADIVKRVMSEKGMKMIEASKYVKQHGLY